jgi:hypothetical protein
MHERGIVHVVFQGRKSDILPGNEANYMSSPHRPVAASFRLLQPKG